MFTVVDVNQYWSLFGLCVFVPHGSLEVESMGASVLLLVGIICTQTNGQTKMYNCGQRQNNTYSDLIVKRI